MGVIILHRRVINGRSVYKCVCMRTRAFDIILPNLLERDDFVAKEIRIGELNIKVSDFVPPFIFIRQA